MSKFIEFEIYSGAGNDFIMIDNLDGKIPFDNEKEFAVKICSERFKDIDGVIFVEKPKLVGSLIRMNYYNRDGSYGAMCGNGARCISQYAFDKGFIKDKVFNLEAVDRTYKAEILGSNIVRISFPTVSDYKLNLKIDAELGKGLKKLNVSWMQVGSEHIVLFPDENKEALGTHNLDEIKVNEWGSMLRHHEDFQPAGANVSFVELISDNKIRIRTYERGVERETLACGTGIISSAIVSCLLKNLKPPIEAHSQSGEWLAVDFEMGEVEVENITLQGSARRV